MTSVLEKLNNLHELAFVFLTHPQFGLQHIADDPDEVALVDRAIAMLERAKAGEEFSREDWTDLKEECAKLIGSPLADAVSQIMSALRNPQAAAISGVRDAGKYIIQANAEAKARRVQALLRKELRVFLSEKD
ncbi:hypothetical protein [Stenomitos frigidus]|uniref:Uncharacterized protein n=1 Tax=Stenomitos frigidus ULC18 TaxID=2107698 RepID=A0A2T1E1N0_9CYAN|nr:hypothetical protein [Stenomitos frigidus]PSB26648.1 hypothetical protein C7B82_19275 [Stenomitos frigidus ULC18]